MPIQERRERERAEREKSIVGAARRLAEAEGWDAVTTRRLAAEIEYSQPVLYSHFTGKCAIMGAVAIQGFAELATELRSARRGADSARLALSEVGAAYIGFARHHPALYDAMFTLTVDLPLATAAVPAALRDAFGELVAAVQPFAPLATAEDTAVLAETFWASLHGLATLTRSGRLPADAHDRRLALLVGYFTAKFTSKLVEGLASDARESGAGR